MRRSYSFVQFVSSAAHIDASTAMSCRPSVVSQHRGGRGRGRGRGRRGFSELPYNEAGRDWAVTGDSHFETVHEVNQRFRQCGGDPSNLNHNPSLHPRHFNNGERPRQPPPRQQFHQLPLDQSHVFRPPPTPRNQWQPYHQPYSQPSNQSYSVYPPPPFYNQKQIFRPPPQRRHQPRSKPSDYREWECAKTVLPPGSEKFVVLSYNILADYLANNHREQLYFHIPRNMLGWESRKRRITFELGLWSADIMCLQEVDRFQDLEKEMTLRGYSGIWKMRTGNAIDGCATFWRSNRFKLVHEESIQFNNLGLRDNVAQICVLELLNSRASKSEVTPSERSAGSHRVVICNIHVLYNPKRGDIKLGQVRTLLHRAHAVSKLWDSAPVVLCGDFNCTPKSPLYNFILEQKLDLSASARNKVSGQESAVISQSRQGNFNPRFQPASKSPQVHFQSSSSILDAQTNNNTHRNDEKATPGNTSELQYSETNLDSPQANADADQVSLSPGEHLSSDGTAEHKSREPNSENPCFVKDLPPVSKSDPELPPYSAVETHPREELLEISVTSDTEESPQVITINDENIIPSGAVFAEGDTSREVKVEDLTLKEPDELVKQGEGLAEDRETFLAVLHGDALNETLAPEVEKTAYDPSSWTPMEIATATGDPERTTVEHHLQLTSTYTEVKGQTNTRDSTGEPEVTSYNRCFMGTVDYIWRSEGLQTVRVLAPMPKQAMQWTPGFPTPKWGSDHVALVSELRFCDREQVNDV